MNNTSTAPHSAALAVLDVPCLDRWLPKLVMASLVLAMATYIAAFGVDVPFWDEFELGKYYERFSRGQLSLVDLLTAKHNEHLVGVSFLLMLMHHLVTGFDVKAILYTGLALQVASLLVLLVQADPLLRSDSTRAWQRVVIALMLLSFAPYTNILWGFQTAWYLVTLLLMLSLSALRAAMREEATLAPLIAGAFFALLASLSSVQGLAAWIAGAVYLVVASGRPFTAAVKQPRFLTWVACSAAGFVLYAVLSALSSVPGAASGSAVLGSLRDPVGLVKFWLLAVGTIAGALPAKWSFAVGAGISALVLLAAIAALRADTRQRYALPLALIAFGATFLVLIALGRLPLGVGAARESRYSAYVLLAIAGAYLIVARGDAARLRVPGIVALRTSIVGATVIAFGFSLYSALVHARDWHMERGIGALVLFTYDRQPDFVIERMLYGNPSLVIGQANFLKRTKQTVFAGSESDIPAVARPYSRPTPSYQRLTAAQPEDAVALQRLWDAYVVGPDVRQVLQYTSATFPYELVRWASGSSKDGGHYLSPYLAPYADRYSHLRDALEAAQRN